MTAFYVIQKCQHSLKKIEKKKIMRAKYDIVQCFIAPMSFIPFEYARKRSHAYYLNENLNRFIMIFYFL